MNIIKGKVLGAEIISGRGGRGIKMKREENVSSKK
jgi:hypothetical protein